MATVLLVSVLAVYKIYTGAEGLTWQFDDAINLSGLSGASTWSGLRDFIFGGVAGPTGRPVSLLAFVPDYQHWPENPWGMVQGSLIWHGLNSALVFLLFYVLLSQQSETRKNSLYLAAAASILWAILPIHASGLLMPVQRMTHVSSFFVLLGLVLFSYLRVCYNSRESWGGLILMFVALLVPGLIAVYSKESGALLLSFVVVIDRVFLRELAPPVNNRVWCFYLLMAALAVPVLLCYQVLADWDGIQSWFKYHRDRTMAEHIATELVILWEYIRQIALPRANILGPFHDAHKVYSWQNIEPYLSLAGWVGMVMAGMFFLRHGFVGRSFAFFVLFFLAGHQIESTVIPLELYFEHRNYLASLGLVLFFVVVAYSCITSRYFLFLVAGAFMALHLFVLQQTASLWGQPLVAAEVWQMNNSKSLRANQMLAWQYGINGYAGALGVLDRYAEVASDPAGVSIQATEIACAFEDREQILSRMERLQSIAPKLRRAAEITTSLAKLGERVRNDKCHGVSVDVYNGVLLALLESESLSYNKKVRHHVYFELALTSRYQGNEAGFIEYAKLAFFDFPSYSVSRVIAAALFQQGDNKAAVDWLDESVLYAPKGVSGKSWRDEASSMKDAIMRVEALLGDR